MTSRLLLDVLNLLCCQQLPNKPIFFNDAFHGKWTHGNRPASVTTPNAMDFRRAQPDRNDFPRSFGRRPPRKKPNVHALSTSDHEHIDKEVAIHCGKVFVIGDNQSDYVLPHGKEYFSSDKWTVKELVDLKSELNGVKSSLNAVDLTSWHEHTSKVNYAASVLKDARRYKPEYLTQAWCKFYDIASNFNLFPHYPDSKTINSLHLCEAPGAFVASLNHFLHSNHPEAQWNWLANSLNPYYEGNDTHQMIVDDRFIAKTLDRWCFGEDSTGDIRQQANVNHIIQQAAEMGPVHLVTADGSVDCFDDPAEQESRVVSLHYYEALVALKVLEKGGSFVLKLFTMFECNTVCLVYLLRCLFQHVVARKPVPSKEGNSEIYLICLGYKGPSASSDVLKSLDRMYSQLEFPSKALFSKGDIPGDLMENMIQCARFFTNIQISVILRNIRLAGQFSATDAVTVATIQRKIAKFFFETCTVERLNTEQYVGKQGICPRILNFPFRKSHGSFEEMISLKSSNPHNILEHYKKILLEFLDDSIVKRGVKWLTLKGIALDSNTIWRVTRGRSFETIKSSLFCPAALIEMHHYLFNLIGLDSSIEIQSSVYDELAEQLQLSFENQRALCCVMTANECVSYSRFQMTLLDKLIVAVKRLSTHDTLILAGVPLLTQFIVALVCYVAHFFNETSFANPKDYDFCLIFSEMTDQGGLVKLLENIRDEVASASKETVLSLVPIEELRSAEILGPVSKLNIEVLRNMSSRMITTLERTF